jgi:hypothetical protein
MTNGFRRAQNDNRHDAFASVSEGCRIDPRWVMLPPVLRTPNELALIREQAKTVRRVGSAAGTVQVDVEYRDRVLRYWFAPDLEYRIVRFELFAGGRVWWVYEYEWQLIDGEVSPNIVILQVPDFQTWQGMFTHRLNLTSVRPVSRLAD